MDLLYVLGRGSTWKDNELRYSLRSVHRHVRGLDRVVVVGHRPPWLRGVHHVSHGDPYQCKERNIMEKIVVGCRFPGLSRRFLFANDDHFALAPCDAEVPYWRGGPLWNLAQRLDPANHYGQALRNTHTALQGNACSTWNYDLHLPMVFDKVLFPLAMACYDWTVPHGYVVKSLYANTVREQGMPAGDVKLVARHTMAELVEKLRGRLWWSTGPSGLGTSLKALLEALYPDPSPYEM
jgi:hypothetical protein